MGEASASSAMTQTGATRPDSAVLKERKDYLGFAQWPRFLTPNNG